MKRCTKAANSRVISVEPLSKRVEVTLKTSTVSDTSKSESMDLSKFHVGDLISGRIKRVEPFGLFIAIDNTNMVFLHPSEPFVIHAFVILKSYDQNKLRASYFLCDFSFLIKYNIIICLSLWFFFIS